MFTCLTLYSCDPHSGACNCKAGWDVRSCSRPCPMPTYGLGCKQKCNCKNNALCSPVDGSCICAAGKWCFCCLYWFLRRVTVIVFFGQVIRGKSVNLNVLPESLERIVPKHATAMVHCVTMKMANATAIQVNYQPHN